jgi:hypothetical protein
LKQEFAFGGRSYAGFHLSLIRKLSSSAASDPLEAGVQKVLSPSERIHFTELLANPGPSKEPTE